MNKKKSPKIAAAIDIGSNMLKMRVCQLTKGELADIDRLEYPLHLGHEVFHDGKISFEGLRELSGILHGYKEVMDEYGTGQYKVVGTTALREASNRDHVIDQLKIQNNMDVLVLEDNQEKSLIYSEILRSLSGMKDLKIKNALLSYIGTGSIGLTVFDGNHMVFSQNVPIGSMKLHDMLSNVENETERYDSVIEEYLDIVVGHIFLPCPIDHISHLVLTGNGIELIAKLRELSPIDGRYVIKAEIITSLFEEIRHLSPLKISYKYHISEENAEILYSSLIIYNHLLSFSKVESVICPKVDLWDAILRQMLVPKAKDAYEKQVAESALSCAQITAHTYNCSAEHSEYVRIFAHKIFEKMKSLYGLSPRMRLLLELSSILHDCGHYVSSRYYLDSTFALIQNMDIYGMTDSEMLMTACISSYSNRGFDPESNARYLQLSQGERLSISKLAAIFQLADALDKSKKQKLSDVKVKLEDDKLIISGKADRDIHLEKWAFDHCSPFFKEVFGISPVLHIKPFSL